MTDYARAWDCWFPIIERGANALSNKMLDHAAVAQGAKVVDLATGVGEPALLAAERVGPGGHVTGLDYSAEMLDFARRRATRAGMDQISFEVQDANRLELEAEHYDAALCRWGLMFVDDPHSVVASILKALRPGGTIALGVWADADRVPALSLAIRTARDCLGLGRPHEGSGTAFALCDGEELAAILRSAGFENCRVEPVTVSYLFDSVDDYIRFRCEVSSPLRDILDQQDVAGRQGILDAIAAAARPFGTREGGLRFDNLTYCVSGVRPQ